LHPYATLTYAKALAHVGRPIYVPAWRTHVIARDWQGRAEDIVGPYPLACLGADSDLEGGIDELRRGGFLSVTLVVDGLTGPPISRFRDAFTIVRPFKTHYLVDASFAPYQPTKHHRDRVRRAARRAVAVRTVALRDGTGLCTVAAFMGRDLVSCQLWFEYNGVAWSHLAASAARGYANSASFAVYDESIHILSGRLINLGGAAGIGDTANDGLAAFKAGFANRTTTAYLIGSVLNPTMYKAMCVDQAPGHGDEYFPAYRRPSTLGEAL
jgi:hypothetical protein